MIRGTFRKSSPISQMGKSNCKSLCHQRLGNGCRTYKTRYLIGVRAEMTTVEIRYLTPNDDRMATEALEIYKA